MKTEYAVQIIWSPEDGAYIAMAGELPGCMADGQTQQEALENLKVVIGEWIEVAKEDKREIPRPMTVLDFARQQQEANEHLQKHIEEQVKNAVQQVLTQIVQRQQVVSGWRGSFSYTYDPSENPMVAAGSRRH